MRNFPYRYRNLITIGTLGGVFALTHLHFLYNPDLLTHLIGTYARYIKWNILDSEPLSCLSRKKDVILNIVTKSVPIFCCSLYLQRRTAYPYTPLTRVTCLISSRYHIIWKRVSKIRSKTSTFIFLQVTSAIWNSWEVLRFILLVKEIGCFR